MHSNDFHLTDVELLEAADGELAAARLEHLARCWACRARQQSIETAIFDFTRFHHDRLDLLLQPSTAPRALLKARLTQLAAGPAPRNVEAWRIWGLVAAGLVLALCVLIPVELRHTARRVTADPTLIPVSFPERSLTPGAVINLDRDQVCRVPRPKNRAVPASLQRRVFDEYGIPEASAAAYEVDYLITPALGGADDIRNLWPQSYSHAVWNAHVKDALEDKLHDLVCEGQLDLAAAQRDLSSDWIAAYKKYFHADEPLATAP